MRCGGCGKEIIRTYWQRTFATTVLCRECWLAPEELAAKLKRDTVAHILWDAHRKDISAAHKAYVSLRGTGIPPKQRRKP